MGRARADEEIGRAPTRPRAKAAVAVIPCPVRKVLVNLGCNLEGNPFSCSTTTSVCAVRVKFIGGRGSSNLLDVLACAVIKRKRLRREAPEAAPSPEPQSDSSGSGIVLKFPISTAHCLANRYYLLSHPLFSAVGRPNEDLRLATPHPPREDIVFLIAAASWVTVA